MLTYVQIKGKKHFWPLPDFRAVPPYRRLAKTQGPDFWPVRRRHPCGAPICPNRRFNSAGRVFHLPKIEGPTRCGSPRRPSGGEKCGSPTATLKG